MTEQQQAVGTRRRTAAEIEQIAAEYASSGLNRSQFCRRAGITLGTLNRYLERCRAGIAGIKGKGGLLAVELASPMPGSEGKSGGGLAVVLAGGRRIEVNAGFDEATLGRLLGILEKQ
jgi:hypothetical protein